jgi:hypothetical protein
MAARVVWSGELAGNGPVSKAIAELAARDARVLKLAGIVLGGCIHNLGSEPDGPWPRYQYGHAHVERGEGPLYGWLCFGGPRRAQLVTRAGWPRYPLLHELAHLTSERWHDQCFLRDLTRLAGGPEPLQRLMRRA